MYVKLGKLGKVIPKVKVNILLESRVPLYLTVSDTKNASDLLLQTVRQSLVAFST